MQFEQLAVEGQKVLVRVDFNVPFDSDKQISDDTRLRGAVPTIKNLLERGAAVILMSHLGRPQKKKLADGTIDRAANTLAPVAPALSALLDTPVRFVEDTVGGEAQISAAALLPGEVLLLENTRFYAGEEKGDEELAADMAKLGSIYVNDAFGAAHREHASTATVAKFFPADKKAFGLLMAAEVAGADRLLNNPARPVTAIVGGAKVSDKILLLEKLMDMADHVLIGGAMAYTFSLAQGGKVGNSLVEADKTALALRLLEMAKEKGVQILLPVDTKVGKGFSNDTPSAIVAAGEIGEGWEGLDIGPETVKQFSEVILKSQSVLWNGPMGVFEMPNFAIGTNAIAKVVAQATQENGAYTLIGGGDSVSAINQAGLADAVSFVSTGGGAMLELLEGKELPGIKAIGA